MVYGFLTCLRCGGRPRSVWLAVTTRWDKRGHSDAYRLSRAAIDTFERMYGFMGKPERWMDNLFNNNIYIYINIRI